MNQIIYTGIGHRKNSIARVVLTPGLGKITINGIDGALYLQLSPNYLRISQSPLTSLGLENKYDIFVNAKGGGLTGQAEAIRLGISRALCEVNIENRVALKFEGYLTRDSRSKERKKYGLRKARKAPQFSKR